LIHVIHSSFWIILQRMKLFWKTKIFIIMISNTPLNQIWSEDSDGEWYIYCFMSISRIFHFWAGGSLSCHTCCDTEPRFSGLIRRTTPFNRLLQLARGCGGPILTGILMGLAIEVHFRWFTSKFVLILHISNIFLNVWFRLKKNLANKAYEYHI
jgi:hypothetical protein